MRIDKNWLKKMKVVKQETATFYNCCLDIRREIAKAKMEAKMEPTALAFTSSRQRAHLSTANLRKRLVRSEDRVVRELLISVIVENGKLSVSPILIQPCPIVF